MIVVWQLTGARGDGRERAALRVIAVAFGPLAIYIAAPATVILVTGSRPRHSTSGIVWLALTVAAMLAPAADSRLGRSPPVPPARAPTTALAGETRSLGDCLPDRRTSSDPGVGAVAAQTPAQPEKHKTRRDGGLYPWTQATSLVVWWRPTEVDR